jgi:hypothetical protein
MKLHRRGGILFLSDGSRDVIALTPMEAEWLSQELQRLVTSEFCVQLHLAAFDAQKNDLEPNPTSKEYELKREWSR